MILQRIHDRPLPLVVAALLTAVEGAVFTLYGVVELASLSAERLAMGVSTTVFFLGYGAGLCLCGWLLSGGSSWARSPVVLAQLLQLGVAWSFRGGATTWVAVSLAVVGLLVLVGLFHPASVAALADDE